jgi:hypothetical protein
MADKKKTVAAKGPSSPGKVPNNFDSGRQAFMADQMQKEMKAQIL